MTMTTTNIVFSPLTTPFRAFQNATNNNSILVFLYVVYSNSVMLKVYDM